MSTPNIDDNGKRGFYDRTVRRPVAIFVLFVTLVVVGLIAYSRIPLQMMPDGLVEPGLEINISHPGSSAQENERKVTRVLEEQIRTLSGIERTVSGSGDDGAWLWVSYSPDMDMDLAKAEMRDRVERARAQMPETVDDIRIFSWSNDSMPIMWFAMLHPGDSERTDFLVEEVIQRKLESVEGTSKVEIYGLLADSVRILLDEERVKEANLNLGELIGRLSADNFARPLGEITDGGRRFLLRSDMRFESLEEIEDYPIGNGLRIRDVGRVIKAKSVRDQLSRIDGSYAYFAAINKESQANTVATSARLKVALEELEADPRLNGEFEFRVLFAQGDFIETSLRQMRTTAIWGGSLAVLVLFMFLRRVRLTLAVALSIPVSSLLAIAWVYFTGGTFNVLTMTGITLGIGMLVDNSVVVIENVSRLKASGASNSRAAALGARDVGLAVSLATLTTVVVFLPLIFMGDNPAMRLMLGALGLPLCVSLVISLFVALVFLPVAAARIVGPRPAGAEFLARILAPIASIPFRLVTYIIGGLRWSARGGLRVLHWGERFALTVLTPLRWPLAIGVVVLAVMRAMEYGEAHRSAGFLEDFGLSPASDRLAPKAVALSIYGIPALFAAGLIVFGLKRWRSARGSFPARPDHYIPRGQSFVDLLVTANRAMVGWALNHRMLATGLAVLIFFSMQIPAGNMNVSSFAQEESRSRINVSVDLEDNFTLEEASEEMSRYEAFFEPHREDFGFAALACRFGQGYGRVTLYWDENQTSEHLADIRNILRTELPTYPGHRVRLYGDETASSRNAAMVEFVIKGPEFDKLIEIGDQAMEILEGVPGLMDVTSPLESAQEQIRVVMNDELASTFGVNANTALQNISWALRGVSLPRYQETGREVPMFIEYDEEQLAGLDTLRDLEIYTGNSVVPLAAFTNIEFTPGTQRIIRRNGQASFSISGRVDNPSLRGRVSAAGYLALAQLELPRGYSIGDEDSIARRDEEELAALKGAAALGLVLVFLLMGILFESFILPASVLTTVFFAISGAYWALFITGTTMDSVGWIGIIILIGVVVNNGIVLIDRIHRLHLGGMPRKEAVLEGAANRVRPILMTAMTTVFGLLPMATGEGESDGIDYRALATCVSGGLVLSTACTVWVVPLAYTLMDDFRHASTRWLGWYGGLPLRGVRRITGRKGTATAESAG